MKKPAKKSNQSRNPLTKISDLPLLLTFCVTPASLIEADEKFSAALENEVRSRLLFLFGEFFPEHIDSDIAPEFVLESIKVAIGNLKMLSEAIRKVKPIREAKWARSEAAKRVLCKAAMPREQKATA